MRSPRNIVRAGYDRASFAYREDQPDKSGETYRQYKAWIEELSDHLPAGCSVLDLGCGCGVPTAQLLTHRFEVTGVDISPVQIERARKLVPKASFICADMCEPDFAADDFDAIVCLYAIIHVPLAEQQNLLAGMWTWLKPGGFLLLSAGHREWTGEEEDWLGVAGARMSWSHADRDTYIRWLEQVGFTLLWDRFIPEGDEGHTLMLAAKAAPPPSLRSIPA
jgi:SAM-dependent methyltransferase